jgi:site-specific DNA-cytosine methylase
MTPPENAIKKNNKMLYAIKKYFTPEGRKRLHIVSVKNNNPIQQNDKKPVINCIQRRGNDFYTIGNKDPFEVVDEVVDEVVNIAEYKNIFVMNQMKTKKKELLEKYNIRLTLTNSGRGSGSRSSSGSTN